MQTLRLPAPAKLNLLLRIVGRRPDGYHLLQTVFQFIDRCDWITLESQEGVIRRLNPLDGVPEDTDLTVRAARALRERYGRPEMGVNITIEKNLPMGGGLGGGSSDAATTLVGLNRLWGLGLDRDALMALGLGLGADVPVFIGGHAAWAEGVGEQLTRLVLPEPWYVVIVPDCHVSTASVFSAPHLTRNNPSITIGGYMAGCRENHCLPVVMDEYPRVRAAMEALSPYSEARLTGTGACVFAAFDDESAARQAAGHLAVDWNVFVARGMNRSPLQEA